MKKILLTCALLFAFGASKANDNVIGKTASKEKATILPKNEKTTKPIKSKTAVMAECWAVSCGTVCDFRPNASQIWSQYDIDVVWSWMDMQYCIR